MILKTTQKKWQKLWKQQLNTKLNEIKNTIFKWKEPKLNRKEEIAAKTPSNRTLTSDPRIS